MAEINKINIKGVDYDIGGGGVGIAIIEKTLQFNQSNPNEATFTEEITEEEYNSLKNRSAILKIKMPIPDIENASMYIDCTNVMIMPIGGVEQMIVIGESLNGHIALSVQIVRGNATAGGYTYLSVVSVSQPLILENVDLDGTEETLTSLSIMGTNYKIPTAGGGENILDIYIDITKVNQENEKVWEIIDALFGFFTTAPIGDAYTNSIAVVMFFAKTMKFSTITNPPKLPNIDNVDLSDLGITQTITTEQLQKVDGVRFRAKDPDSQEEYSTIILKSTAPIIGISFGVSVAIPLEGQELNCFHSEVYFSPDTQNVVQGLFISSGMFSLTTTQ